jgi:D-sedoheptulose 7-phosphate isomerase
MFIDDYLSEVVQIAKNLNYDEIDKIVTIIYETRENDGRCFFLGSGGSLASCSHAVNDFRKIIGIESYSPGDNASELTARTNDSGFETVFVEWLKTSRLTSKDMICVASVGGGDKVKKLSENLILAIDYAKEIGSKVVGVVGKSGGYTGIHADARVIIPIININRVTPHAEEFFMVIIHLLVSHPLLQKYETTWESRK